MPSYFDKKISFNFKLFKKDFDFILKNGYSEFIYEYDFKNKSIKKIYKETKNIDVLIIEGIFGKEIINQNPGKFFILIKLKTSKKICMKRVVKRDFIERNKSKDRAQKDFIKAWEVFQKNNKNHQKYNKNNKMLNIEITKKTNLGLIIKKIIQ